MDKTADPCVDFYQYSCGGWMKNNPIPADQASWSVYGKLTQENQQFLWGILDDLSKKTSGRNQNQQKIGDYFAACMDESAIEKLGSRPIQPYLAEIDGITSKQQLPALLADLHLRTEGSGIFFGFGARQDFDDSTQVIAFASAGGLGLPDRDYYTRRTQSRLNFGRNTLRTCSACWNCWATLRTQHSAKPLVSWRWKRSWPRLPLLASNAAIRAISITRLTSSSYKRSLLISIGTLIS